ncbi:MAG: 3-phosphoserine/phosphohydroxythreonine transaminase [Planctomycetes bacterium]|nr:3-phosphoserine/phosphohydroxythreonine transaminase [Planctomycetota bacterium]
MARVHNFCAGPAALPLPVLEKAQAELLDFNGNGMSLMEMSHRSKAFDEVINTAEANIRKLMGISDDYAVLFLQGGASHQFAMLPMNLMAGKAADYINTGAWAKKAISEAKLAGKVNVVWDGADDKYNRMPKADEYTLNSDAAYVHICSNETIGGIRFTDFPKTEAPLIADMSSEIMSRELDVNQFGMIYAGAQKNIGPSGLALVVIRKDLAERCPETAPKIMRYSTHIAENSLYNTPNTWGIYIVKLVTDWLLGLGGVSAMEKINEEKAKVLYDAIDGSDFWKPVAAKEYRSTMNVCWTTPNEELDAKFVKEATAANLSGLKGHRSVGGLRASIYNACPREAIDALVNFMKEFEAKNG